MGKTFTIWLLAVALTPSALWAQENEDANPKTQTEEDQKLAPEQDLKAAFQEELAAQERRFNKQLDLQKNEIEQLKLHLGNNADAAEDEFIAEEETDAFDKYFRIFGFFDVSLYKWFWEKDEAYNLWVHDDLTFLVSNLNIYFNSQISRSLSAVSEIKFSFLPFGQEYGFEAEYNGADTGQKYSAVGGKEGHFYRDPLSSQEYYTGGIYIERVYLDYAPLDWLKIKAGRFLSPYGIWNIEHGSPIVTMVRVPYMQIRAMVPLAQTGLEIYGRFFPTYELFLDYALTVSNGRERFSFQDLDDKKAFGARLHLSYEGDKATVSFGGYLYYGNYTKIRKQVLIDTENKKLGVKQIDEGVRNELVIATDLLVKFWGIKLQSEFIYRRDEVEVPRPLLYEDQVLLAGDLTGELTGDYIYFDPSNTGYDVYTLLAYTLPLQRWLGQFLITPYVYWERSRYMDTKPILNLTQYVGGINLQPHPNVVLKLEASYLRAEDDRQGKPFKNLAAQVAVSF